MQGKGGPSKFKVYLDFQLGISSVELPSVALVADEDCETTKSQL